MTKGLAVIRWVAPRSTKNPDVTRWVIVAHLKTPGSNLARPDEMILHTIDAWKASLAERIKAEGKDAYLEWKATQWGPELTHIAHGEAA